MSILVTDMMATLGNMNFILSADDTDDDSSYSDNYYTDDDDDDVCGSGSCKLRVVYEDDEHN